MSSYLKVASQGHPSRGVNGYSTHTSKNKNIKFRQDQCRGTPIHLAASYGNIEIDKMLAPLSDNPNTPDEYRRTPIHFAATNGNAEIIKILAPLSDNPNAPNVVGNTPMDSAITNGHIEVVRILVSCQKSAKRRRIERRLNHK